MDIETNIENIKIKAIHKFLPTALYGVKCAPQTKPSKEPVCATGNCDITFPSAETKALIPE